MSDLVSERERGRKGRGGRGGEEEEGGREGGREGECVPGSNL